MTPENPPLPDTAPVPPAIRPPDFLLSKADQTTGRPRRVGEPDIYVSWGGKIYGPAGVDDVITGVRTAYFGDDAVFWFEGRTDWRPVEELSGLFEGETTELPAKAGPLTPPPEPIRPHWPGTESSARSSRGQRRRHNRKNRPSNSARRGRAGRLIVLGAVLLAVALTAGLLLLVSLV